MQEKCPVEAPDVGAAGDEAHNLAPFFGYEKV